VRKGFAKVSWNPGQFRAVLLLIGDRRGRLRWNSIQATHRRQTGCIVVRVFEVKKEIRASTRDRSFRELDIS
jgi:hypothetical protein